MRCLNALNSITATVTTAMTTGLLLLMCKRTQGLPGQLQNSKPEWHGINQHREEYEAALLLIEKHAALWPAVKTQE